ncbi:MAG: hypothetical protein JJU46_06495 [Balneolaceae bacterium]|nr:hypothetical protein [Balneolaceae bacterium]MCH8548894.1 hypothetical protein [Balneolaceae bacterium]
MRTVTRNENKIKIPKLLHELHGELSNWRDVGLTHMAAWGLTVLMVWLSVCSGHPIWITVLLAILTVDIAGGVVSNFTKGTNNYYEQYPQKRVVFLLLHIIQPALLSMMFPDQVFLILAVMAYTLSISIWLDGSRKFEFPKSVSPFLTIVGITGLVIMPIEFIGLQLLLILYITKLILAFSVNWYKSVD